MGSGSSKKKKLGAVTAAQKWKKKKRKAKADSDSEDEGKINYEDEDDEEEKVQKEEEEPEEEECEEEEEEEEEEGEEEEGEGEEEEEKEEKDKQGVEETDDEDADEEYSNKDDESENGDARANLTDYSGKMQKALFGDLDIEFPENVKVVRIFTSSTFTDTSVERNTLMVQVYPRIKKFCQERGYEFQVVDMRWGVRDESTDDHLTSELCMKELRACQKLSTGPNFITFLGQKYGYRPFPPKIPATEFELLLSAVDSKDDIELLKLWFVRDDNTVPSEYLLQPITSVLPDYRNYGNPALRKQASSMWWVAFERMQVVFRMAADKVLTKRNDRLKYYMSVTEDEIRRGIINAKSPSTHTFWFKRVITDIDNHTADAKVGSFMDKTWGTPGEIDKEAQSLLNNLREKDLQKAISKKNIIQYNVKWNKNGIDPDVSSEHAQYIKTLCKDFYEKLTEMISSGIVENENADTREPLAEDIFQHLSFCQKKCKAFFGRRDFLESIKNRLLNNDKRTVVLYGESGCGKTSLMAKVATDVKSWFDEESILVVCRFIGTSPESSSIRPLLRSVCRQLCKISGENANIPEDIKSLVEFFPECLDKASQNMKLVLVLDSLDQLSVDDSGRLLDWLPRDLPSNVYAVLSTLPGEQYQCLPSLRLKFPEESLMEVPQIPLNEAHIILDNWLKAAKRTLQPKQRHEVMISFQECPLPLYLKLAFDESCRWKSYTPFKEWDLPPNVRDIIRGLFDRVERIHGKVLVGHALGYITASKNGLTEIELEDLLSLDDDVLNDVYQYWTPPIRRLPPLLWIRIRGDIKDYLIDRGADGTRVIYWYHRQFIEVARERYLNGEQAKKIHSNLSEYFLGTWAEGRKKPYINKKGEKHADDRLVASQPMMFDTSDEKPIFNLRKLSELPYHFFFSEKYDKMKEEALCNFEFLLSKLRGTSVESVLEDFSLYLSVLPRDPDVKIMNECLRLSLHPLSVEPKQFSTQLLGRMLKFQETEKYPYVCTILQQAQNASVPCFIPNNKFLTAPGGALVSTIALGGYGNECISLASDNQTMAVTCVGGEGLEIKIIDYQSGKQLRKFTVTDPPSMYRITMNAISQKDKNFLLLAGGKTIFILNTETGQIMKQFEVDDDDWFSYNQKPPVAYADDESLLVALTRNSLRVWQVLDCKVIHEIPVKDINVEDEIGNLDARGKYTVYNLKSKNTVHFVDLKRGREVDKVVIKSKKADGDIAAINDLKITKRDEVVVVPGSLDSLRIYDLHTANLVREITTFKMMQGMGRVEITEDGTKALGIDMFEICTTNLLTGESERSLRSSIFRLKIFTRDGDTILAVGQDFILRVYDRTRERDDENQADTKVVEYQGHKIADQITSIAPGFDRRHVIAMATVQLTNHMSVWDCVTGKKVRQTKGMRVFPNPIRLNRDSTRGVGYIYDEKHPHYKVFNFKDGIIEKTLEGSACKRMNAFGMIDDHRMISFTKGRKNLKVWDINSGKVIDIIKFKVKHLFQEMMLSTNGKMAVLSVSSTSETYPENTTLPLYAYNTTNKQNKVITLKDTVLSLYNAQISDDGMYLVCIVAYTTPYLIDLETGEIKYKLLKPDSYEGSMTAAINTVCNIIVTGVGQGGINVWDLNTGAILRTIPCDVVSNVYLSADGEVVFARDSKANTINTWDVNSGRKLATITTDGYPNQVHIVGDRLVVAVGENPNVMIMRLHIPGKLNEKNMSGTPSPYDNLPLDVEIKDLSGGFIEKDPMDNDKYDRGNVM